MKIVASVPLRDQYNTRGRHMNASHFGYVSKAGTRELVRVQELVDTGVRDDAIFSFIFTYSESSGQTYPPTMPCDFTRLLPGVESGLDVAKNELWI